MLPGLVQEVVPHSQLLARAQEVAEGWAREGRTKQIPAGGTVQEYKEVNARESLELADAFLSYNFLNVSISIIPNICCSMLDCNLISDPSDVERKCQKLNVILQAQYEFLKSKGKSSQANVFMLIKTLRPLWSKLL